MTPQERWEYKLKWLKEPVQVDAPSDLKYDLMDWCRTRLDQHLYEYRPFIGPYYDRYLFESVVDALAFSKFLVERKHEISVENNG